MSSRRKRHRLALAIVATDSTFTKRHVRGSDLWVGKCIFCSRALTVGLDGALDSAITIEHIQPRSHGGDDAVVNLALACKGCNNEKGMRHDARRKGDPRLAEIVEALRARRKDRWRSPTEVGLDQALSDLRADGDE